MSYEEIRRFIDEIGEAGARVSWVPTRSAIADYVVEIAGTIDIILPAYAYKKRDLSKTEATELIVALKERIDGDLSSWLNKNDPPHREAIIHCCLMLDNLQEKLWDNWNDNDLQIVDREPLFTLFFPIFHGIYEQVALQALDADDARSIYMLRECKSISPDFDKLLPLAADQSGKFIEVCYHEESGQMIGLHFGKAAEELTVTSNRTMRGHMQTLPYPPVSIDQFVEDLGQSLSSDKGDKYAVNIMTRILSRALRQAAFRDPVVPDYAKLAAGNTIKRLKPKIKELLV